MGVKDEFHQRAILVCIDELCQRSTKESESMVTANGDVESTSTCHAGMAPPPPHRMVESSFQSLERCDKCNKFLRGLLHQGLICHCTSRQLSHIHWTTFYLFLFDVYSLRADCPSHLLRNWPASLPSRTARTCPSAQQPDRFVVGRRYNLNTSSASSSSYSCSTIVDLCVRLLL